MTVKQLRNQIVKLLWDYMGIPIILSNQAEPEAEAPFGIYTMTPPHPGNDEIGDITWRPDDGDELMEDRMEMPTATMSFTFCSENREGEDGELISGEDEADALAEKAVGFFRHVGYDHFAALGICIVEIGAVQDRTALMVDEVSRRKGFDVRIRYTRIDTRHIHIVEHTNTITKE